MTFNASILRPDVQQFIRDYGKGDITALLLGKPIFWDVSNQELTEQILARGKCEKKLPTWYGTKDIYYPNKLSVEQSSSEKTAHYKSTLVKGKTLLDLTGGLGVDSYYLSQNMEKVFHIEKNPTLSQIARHNFKILGGNTVEGICGDGLKFLVGNPMTYDGIYIDPSRRNQTKGKVFHLSDCSPDVTRHLGHLFDRTDLILLKTSPLLDISMGIAQLGSVAEVHIVAVANEVKELLWLLRKEWQGPTLIKVVDLHHGTVPAVAFSHGDEKKAKTRFSLPKKYLYDSNVALLKSGGFALIGQHYGLEKLHQHTHLYTSDGLIPFLGRRFVIEQRIPFNSRNAMALGIKKANIIAKNFPMGVTTIRKKFKILDGGDTYLYFITNSNNQKEILLCSRVKEPI